MWGELDMIKYSELDENYILTYFPELKEQVKSETDGYPGFLPHIVFANIFCRRVAEILKLEDSSENDFVHRVFEMYEDMAANGDDEVKSLLEVSLLEYLWDEKKTYQKAMELMGERTREIWNDIGSYLNKPC